MAELNSPREQDTGAQDSGAGQDSAPESVPATAGAGWNRRAAIGLIVAAVLLLVGGILWCRLAPQNGLAQDGNHDQDKDKTPASALFQNWGKPDLVLVVTGQMHGYLQPCGCSAPQYGGLARRYHFIKSLEAKGWPVAAVDVGDIAQTHGAPHDQLLLKYSTALDALRLMRYTAVAPGKSEFEFPLTAAFDVYFANQATPVMVAANLMGREKKFFNIIKAWTPADKTSPRVGVVGLVTKSLREELEKEKNPDAHFAPKDKSVALLEDTLKEMAKEKVEFGVLLAQGKEADPARRGKDPAFEDAENCARLAADMRQKNPALPPINVIVHVTHQPLPPAVPQKVGDTWLVSVGHKGQRVGVIGIYKNQRGGFSMKYELVTIGPEYETKAGQEKNNPVMALMEKYTQEVKRRDLMAKFGRTMHPIQVSFPNASYVGSRRCGFCHQDAYKIWSTPPPNQKLWHSVAYDTLESAKHPSLRQFDGECVVCHTVGFEHKKGFYDPAFQGDKAQKEQQNKILRHVGCESCHGPGSEHIRLENAFPGNPKFGLDRDKMHSLMNPYKAKPEELDPATPADRRDTLHKRRMTQINIACQKCHDVDNDVHWDFERSWPKIIHLTPKKGQQGGAPKGQ